MHINGRGHRPLTSPFSRGRGGRLCETGFNDPIVDLCRAPPYSTYSLLCVFFHPVRTTPKGVCVSLNRPAACVKGLDFFSLFLKSAALSVTCRLHSAASSRCSTLPTSVFTSSPITSSCPRPLLLPSPGLISSPSLFSGCTF